MQASILGLDFDYSLCAKKALFFDFKNHFRSFKKKKLQKLVEICKFIEYAANEKQKNLKKTRRLLTQFISNVIPMFKQKLCQKSTCS